MRNPECAKYNACLSMALHEKYKIECEKCRNFLPRKGDYDTPLDDSIKPLIEKENAMLPSKKICEIQPCDKKPTTKGLCSTHTYQWRHGKIDHPRLGKFTSDSKLIRSFRKAEKNMEKNLDEAHLQFNKAMETGTKGQQLIVDLLRDHLRKVKTLADCLKILEYGDPRLEIKTYLVDYMEK
jgi:hypothetical protein